jgi:hypothetical protein
LSGLQRGCDGFRIRPRAAKLRFQPPVKFLHFDRAFGTARGSRFGAKLGKFFVLVHELLFSPFAAILAGGDNTLFRDNRCSLSLVLAS